MRKQKGFTLVELLVVIAIIGILVGLLLPAVQSAREAARRMQCSNNMKNLGLACHNYHDTYKSLPPGWVGPNRIGIVGGNGDTKGQVRCFGWGTFILPFMEQQPLLDKIDPNKNTFADAIALHGQAGGVMTVPIESFKCPSSVAPDKNTRWALGSPGGLSLTNYLGVHGTYFHENNIQSRRGQTGCFQMDTGIKFRDILDGTANTFLLGERVWQYKRADNGNWATAGAGVIYGCNDVREQRRRQIGAVVGIALVRINYDGWSTVDAGNRDDRRSSHFSSRHPGGTQFTLADASVRFIPETIEFAMTSETNPNGGQYQRAQNGAADSVYERLIARADGQPVQVP